MKSPRDYAQSLLAKASHDLIAARATVATGKALDTVCFQAQQAVEKSLKALLALKDVEFPWRHDLGELLGLVRSHYPPLTIPVDEVLDLTPLCSAGAVRRYLDTGHSGSPTSLGPCRASLRTGQSDHQVE